jgi:uncharacterized repeat protein (TIGR02543 family)
MKKRDSVNKKLLCIGAICSLVSLFTACEALSPEPEPVTVSYEKAVVRVQIGNGVPGRTVMPDVASQGINWKLRGKWGDNTETPLLEFTNTANQTIALEPGKWSFTIEGYKDSDHILSGSIAEQTIRLEETQTLTFEVEPVKNEDEVEPVESEGSGDISITIKFPADSGVTSVRVRKDRADYDTITVSGSEILFEEEDIPVGEYHFSFSLYKGDKLLGVVSEMVHVWKHLESAKTYTLLQKDLNLVYTIKYHVPDDTTPVPDGQYQIAATATLAEPSPRPGSPFKGWYANEDFSGGVVTRIPVGSTGDRDFYSKWIKTFSDYPLADALDEIMNGQEADEEYIILLKENETLGPQPALNVTGGKELAITIDGSGKTISLGSNGSLFTLGADTDSSLTLVLEDITLEGKDGNNAPVVKVNSGGNLDLQDGSVLTGNTSSSSSGGVLVNSGGTLTMSGGEISGNTVSGGSNGSGGVYIDGGTFSMSGGEISGNRTIQSNSTTQYACGGVYVTGGGTFEMTGGTISDNHAIQSNSGPKYCSGGVFVSGATFTMTNGVISGNSSTYGGGVYLGGGSFTMSNGTISGNTATANAGGVMVNGGTFTMNNGVVSGNIANGSGGGVYINAGAFIMKDGELSGNTAASNGGGVFVNSNHTFTKASSGVIYGSDASAGLKNTAGSGNGHAVYAVSGPKKRNSTVEAGETMNSAQTGAEGGWVDHWTVSFNADGGAPSAQTATVNSGASLGASMPPDPSHDDYAFGGWYTEQNGGGTQFTATTTVSGAITVYAFWLL